jgi:hypothetical protein
MDPMITATETATFHDVLSALGPVGAYARPWADISLRSVAKNQS